MNVEEITAYKCGKCGSAYTTQSAAEACCEPESKPKKVCEDCGTELDPKRYFIVCDNCLETRRYNKCKKMTIEEYEAEFPDNMVIVGYDNFYSSVEDALESCYGDEESIPHYVYGTKEVLVMVDVEGAVECALENAYEDAEFNNLDELYRFVDGWNKRNCLTMFEETKIVIDIPEELRTQYVE